MKKKIIFFHLFNNYSGSPRVLADVISIVKNNYDIVLVTSNTEGFLSSLNVETRLINYDWSNNKLITLFRFIYAQLNFIFFALKYSKSDTIFYINTQQPSIAGFIGKILRVPVVFHIHETSISQKYFGKIYKLIRKYVNGFEVFVSNYIYQKEIINKDCSEIIYNTISTQVEDVSLKSNYKYKYNDFFNVLMICSMRDYKGIPEFSQIAQILQVDESIKFNLLLDGSERDIRKFMFSKEIPSNVSIHSRSNSPERYLKECSLLLNLSRTDQWIETFGLTVLEAINFGIPCIVPPIGGPTEIIDDGINGYCISSYDINTISKKIKVLSQNKIKTMELSRQSKLKSDFFSRDKFRKQILIFLNKIK
jgi:glycosyltransferase involved in cell wall biosynthesis